MQQPALILLDKHARIPYIQNMQAMWFYKEG